MAKAKATKLNMAQAFDEWMRLYKKYPDEFINEMSAARDHKRKRRGAVASDYGEGCGRILRKLMAGKPLSWQQ